MGCSGLRKGAWTSEEDELLRKCMEQYGAVRWSLVPKRASLSRCPKSCRLRWSNYLCPSIKRGKFEDAEVDLIIRLHKLLGNRWSLIAGRLPGRTANDVKNFWNTHLSKQLLAEKHGKEAEAAYVEVIKPQPQTIPWNWKWSKDNEAPESNNQQEEANILKHLSTSSSTNATCLESKNFSASNIEEVGMMQELQAQFRSEDIGSFGHDDSLLEGFLGWEDMHADISLWSDFEYILIFSPSPKTEPCFDGPRMRQKTLERKGGN